MTRRRGAWDRLRELLEEAISRPDWPDVMRRALKTGLQVFFAMVTLDALRGDDPIGVLWHGVEGAAGAVFTLGWNTVQAWAFKP